MLGGTTGSSGGGPGLSERGTGVLLDWPRGEGPGTGDEGERWKDGGGVVDDDAMLLLMAALAAAA